MENGSLSCETTSVFPSLILAIAAMKHQVLCDL